VLNLSNWPHGFRGPVIVTVVERECSNIIKSLQKRKTRFCFSRFSDSAQGIDRTRRGVSLQRIYWISKQSECYCAKGKSNSDRSEVISYVLTMMTTMMMMMMIRMLLPQVDLQDRIGKYTQFDYRRLLRTLIERETIRASSVGRFSALFVRGAK